MRKPSTVRDYASQTRLYLLDELGADLPLDELTTERIAEWQQELLERGHLSPRTIQKAQVCLHALLKRAKEKRWVERNAAEDADRISMKPSGDFNVFSVEEAEALVRAAADDTDAAIFRTAIGCGLRMGELRALRWRDVQREHEDAIVWLSTQLERQPSGATVLTERECRRRASDGIARYSVPVVASGPRPDRTRWPDLVVEDSERRIAYEIEFSPKHTLRPQTILRGYTVRGTYDEVVFLVRSPSLAQRLQCSPARRARHPASCRRRSRCASSPSRYLSAEQHGSRGVIGWARSELAS